MSTNKTMEPIAVESNFEGTTPKPLPLEHVGTPTHSNPVSPRAPQYASSTAASPVKTKRVSVAEATEDSLTARHRYSASILQEPTPAREKASNNKIDPSSSEFFTALASQERRVLELKDELKKAEDELQRLKKQWASQESSKRRSEGRHLHQMRPMSVSTMNTGFVKDDTDGSSAWMYEEMERRKTLLGNSRSSSRRTFSGSRHTKTLSLVAQASEQKRPTSGSSRDSDASSQRTPNRITRASTTQNIPRAQQEDGMPPHFRRRSTQLKQGDLLVRSSKQLATDWKEGLWTFFEDLRNATVGDETKGSETPTVSPLVTEPSVPYVGQNLDTSQSPSPSMHTQNGNADFDTKTQKNSAETPKKPVNLRLLDVDGETWETWSSPIEPDRTSSGQSSTTSERQGMSSPSPQESSPATSIGTANDLPPRRDSLKNREAIPWPKLPKLGTSQLKKTASHLMEEWERSLSPPSDKHEQHDEKNRILDEPVSQVTSMRLGLG